MKLIAHTALWGPARLPHNVGDVFECDDEIAADLIARKLASPSEDDAPTTESLVKKAQAAQAEKDLVAHLAPAFELYRTDKAKFEALAAAYAAQFAPNEAKTTAPAKPATK